jgi:hypothetical protein
MTRKNRRKLADLDRLTEALVEDILASPDVDLLAEAHADHEDGVAVARGAFERASRAASLRRLPGKATRGVPPAPANIRALDPKTARGWLDEFIACNPETASKLARSGERLSDEDVYGVLERLQERGILGQSGIEHGW